MEPHLIVSLFLDYLGTLHHWTTARVLCRQMRDIVNTRPYAKDLYGARTFIRQNQCMGCFKHSANFRRYTVLIMRIGCQGRYSAMSSTVDKVGRLCLARAWRAARPNPLAQGYGGTFPACRRVPPAIDKIGRLCLVATRLAADPVPLASFRG